MTWIFTSQGITKKVPDIQDPQNDDPDEPDDPDTPEEPKEPDPFEEYQVKITATVTPWKPGNGGNADL